MKYGTREQERNYLCVGKSAKKSGIGRVESMKTWKNKTGKCENMKKIEVLENIELENIRKIGSIGKI